MELAHKHKHKSTITSKSLSMKTKRQIVQTYIIPVAMYATETVAWTHPLINKMKVFQNHLMRWMCGKRLSDQVSVEQLKETTKLENIEETIISKKLVWFGHLKRAVIPAKVICEGLIPGKRRRGRPSWRWIDDALKWSNKHTGQLNELVWNRNAWRNLRYNFN